MEARVPLAHSPTSALDAVASLWGSDDPFRTRTTTKMGAEQQVEFQASQEAIEKNSDIKLLSSVSSLWGSEEPIFGGGASKQIPALLASSELPSTGVRVSATEQSHSDMRDRSNGNNAFCVEPIFSKQAPRRPPPMRSQNPAVVERPPAAIQQNRMPVCVAPSMASPSSNSSHDFYPANCFQGARFGYVFKMGDKGLGYYQDLVQQARRVQSPWSNGPAQSFGSSHLNRQELSGRHSTDTEPQQRLRYATTIEQQHPAIDFGRRMAGSSEEPAVDAMEFGQPEGMEHLEAASEEEATIVLAAQMPPLEARDLGSHGIWGGDMDFHPMAMDYLPMTGEEEEKFEQAPPVPQPQVLPQPPQQQLPPDPEWVLAAPEVAQDMRRPEGYWTDPLQRAEFCEAIDHGRARPEDGPPQDRINTDRLPDLSPYGERVYVEERWDESRVLHPYYEGIQPMHQQQASWGAGFQQHPVWAAHGSTHHSQPSYEAQCQNRIQPTPSSRTVSLPTGLKSASDVSGAAPSNLAARLGSVIAHLEKGETSDMAISDLREIEATYNASLNSRGRS